MYYLHYNLLEYPTEYYGIPTKLFIYEPENKIKNLMYHKVGIRIINTMFLESIFYFLTIPIKAVLMYHIRVFI